MLFTMLVQNLVFVDGMQFMNSSLDLLVKSLSDIGFKYLSEEFNGDSLKLVKQKIVCPCEYMDSFKKFSKGRLPDRYKFFSSLKDECISEKDYLTSIDVWNVFKMNTMGDYHDVYLKGFFQRFINTCLDYYGLDPYHYSSSPGLSWDAMLKMTGIELEFISDIDMHLFIEKGMRGRISYIAKRLSKANKYMKYYEQYKESKYITYLDANNLYGCALNQYLSYSEFEWLKQKEIDRFNVNSIECNSIGYILEVELEYSDELHKLHNGYLLAPEKLEISQNMLSNYCVILQMFMV